MPAASVPHLHGLAARGRLARADRRRHRRRSHLSVAIDQSELLVAVSELEPLPPTVARLAQVFSSGNWSADEIEEIITLDQALAARVLSRANSAASASAVEVVRVRDAVVRIGIGPVLSLVTGHAVRGTVQPALIEYGLTEGELWRHSVASALAVEVLASACSHPLPAESFAAALLHDIGKLIMVRFLDSSQLVLIAEARDREHLSAIEAEVDVLGVHHGEAGGLVARHWKLPRRIVAGITHHHEPDAGSDLVCDVVHVANVLAKRVGTGVIEIGQDDQVHQPCLERLGLASGSLDDVEARLADRLAAVESLYG